MLNRSAKENQIQKLKKGFEESKASFVVNCIGLNVEQMTRFRKKLKQNQGNIQIIRNTLSLKAMEGKELLKQSYSPFMKGPNAFVLAYEDPVKIAKVIDEMEEEIEFFEVKGGVLENQALDKAEVKTLASLPSEELLKAQFLGLLSAPLTKFLGVLQATSQSFAFLLSALKDQKQKDEKK